MSNRNACVALLISTSMAASPTSKPAPGPYWPLEPRAHAAAESYMSNRPIVGTSYFYWYDVYTSAHIRNADGTDALTTHPPTSAMADVSYKSVEWHYSQLRDIKEAGIDFILPVFWGIPGEYTSWSFAGLPPLVEAHNRLLAESQTAASRPAPPMIGMFYDTSTLLYNKSTGNQLQAGEKIDLTTFAGREWFYATIRDFFSLIPPDKWARIDGKPIVFLYAAEFAKAVDDKLFPDTQRRFFKDFGTELFIVREQSWPGRSDASYRWGGALGLTVGDAVAGLGPGYDHSAVPGRKRLVVSRQNGAFYDKQWERLLRMKTVRRPWIVHVETWNEHHEGTDVARSEEYGDLFIRATARHAHLFKSGTQLDPQGPFARADRVRWFGRQVEGLELLPSGGDGCWQAVSLDGSVSAAAAPCPPESPAAYLYFRVDDSYMYDELDRAAEITIVFRDDGGCEQFAVEYDNTDPKASPREGAFRPTDAVQIGSSGTWRTVKMVLPSVRFVDRTNNADFRLSITGLKRRLTVRELVIRKLPGLEFELDNSTGP